MKKQDRLLIENNRQMAKMLRKDLDDLLAKVEGQGALLTELYSEVQSFKKHGKRKLLKAVQVPEDKAEQVRRERAAKKRMESNLPG